LAQQFNVGTVLGGRYRVTERVLISNDDDHVLRGFDQVLDRPVSILVAAPVNAAQAATSAREIATGERIGNVQILDLGLSEGRTYLITNIAESEDLLDLVMEAQKNAPYIEPFMTDTLGSEIFGEARAFEPHVYEDDDEYYHELAQQNRPVNPGLQQRLNDIKSRFGRSKDSNDDDAAQESARPAVEEYTPEETVSQDSSKDSEPLVQESRVAETKDTDTQPREAQQPSAAVSAPRRGTRFSTPPPRPEHEPKVSQLADEEPAADEVVEERPFASAYSRGNDVPESDVRSRDAVEPADAPDKTDDFDEADESSVNDRRGAAGRYVAGAAAGIAGAGAAMLGRVRGNNQNTTPEEAPEETPEFLSDDNNEQWDDADYESEAGYYDDDDDSEVDRDKEARTRRLVIGALLGLVLIVAVVFAFQALSPRGNTAAQSSAAASNSSAAGSTAASGNTSQSAPANTVTPEIVGLERNVPGNQALTAERDNLLPRAFDGNEGTLYRTFSFSNAKFGGFADSMELIVELKEQADVSELELSGLNGTGGAFEILVGDSNDKSSATAVAQGSFTGPTVTVPVANDQGAPAKAKYVFINITELPRQAAPSSPERPFGLQIAEIKVK